MTHARALRRTGPDHGRTTLRRLATAGSTAAIVATCILGAANSASASSTSAGGASTADLRASVIELTNTARAVKGCDPLKDKAQLTRAAQAHAADMAATRYFSHTSKNGRSWDDRILAAGWKSPGGENIAFGFDDATRVVKAWMDSPGHRRNILDCTFTSIGVGYSATGGYWVQDFGY